jgi:SAM-dependent methyltransferase
VSSAPVCPLCAGEPLEPLFRYDSPPAGETAFDIPDAEYEREFLRCPRCGHLVGVNAIDMDRIYSGGYVDATYSADGIASTYDRVMSLPPERSDNVRRVDRIESWWSLNAPSGAERTVLDVGSGLGVFPARMKEAGWRCTALDPDPRAVAHARDCIGVDAVCADFMEQDGLGEFSLVSFNKVLEHVVDPVAMLRRSATVLSPGGVVYVEVPDGELAATDPDGPGREEFFIEHLCAFSAASLALLAVRAGLTSRLIARLREPSGKYTLYAFLSRA